MNRLILITFLSMAVPETLKNVCFPKPCAPAVLDSTSGLITALMAAKAMAVRARKPVHGPYRTRPLPHRTHLRKLTRGINQLSQL